MTETIKQYLEDAIAAEKSFETQLQGFAAEAQTPQARELFTQHASETKQQYAELTARLETLGGSTSSLKGFFAQLFNMSPKVAQLGHEDEERAAQDLMMAFAVENAEVAMYEALAIACEAGGDMITAQLAKKIQGQEQIAADKLWPLIGPASTLGYLAAAKQSSNALVPYLEDAEAAERNFEDTLAGFSKAGDQAQVKSLLWTMSLKARTQHQRLRLRLEALGGTTSTAKSVLAHLLAFTPVTAQLGHSDAEKSTQHLMITYSAAAAEMAMYEALAAASDAAGDETTAALARTLQAEEKEDHRMAWQALPMSAHATAESLAAVQSH